PFGPGIPGEAWERARKRHPSGAAAWQRGGVDLKALTLPPHATRAEYINRVRTLLSEGPGTKARRYAAETIARERLLGALTELDEPAEQSSSLEQFARELLEALTLVTTPA